MHPADINSSLRRLSLNHQHIGDQCDVSASAVGKVIRGESRSAKIEKAISDKLGMPLHVLWPQYYSAPDQPEPVKAPDPNDVLAQLLMQQFSRLDLASKARALQFVTELAGGVATQQGGSASVTFHGTAKGTQFHDNRGSSAPMTFNMGKKSK